jgi:hypothetical protein
MNSKEKGRRKKKEVRKLRHSCLPAPGTPHQAPSTKH